MGVFRSHRRFRRGKYRSRSSKNRHVGQAYDHGRAAEEEEHRQ